MKSYTAFYCVKQIKAFLLLLAQAGVAGSALLVPEGPQRNPMTPIKLEFKNDCTV